MHEATSGLPGSMNVTTWKTSLFQDEPYVDNYREFRRQRGPPISPLEAPETLPGIPEGVDPGQLPTAEMLRESLAAADHAALHPEVRLELPELAGCASRGCGLPGHRHTRASNPSTLGCRLKCVVQGCQ